MKFLSAAFACLYGGEGRRTGGLVTLLKWLLISGFHIQRSLQILVVRKGFGYSQRAAVVVT